MDRSKIEVSDWWYRAFPQTRTASELKGHAKGDPRMVIVVSYDICEPKRLRRVAECCLDFGIRVQQSVFECRLEADQFDRFWARLQEIADPTEDKIVAYPLHGSQADQIRTFGQMVCSEQVVAYIF